MDEEALRKACFMVGTNVLDTTILSDQACRPTKSKVGWSVAFVFSKIRSSCRPPSDVEETGTYHHRAEFDHGVVRGTVYRLAEYWLRTRLAETEQTIPDQRHQPTSRPTMRWVFQCFEGVELLHVQTASTLLTVVLRLEPVHRLILALLGPLYEHLSQSSG